MRAMGSELAQAPEPAGLPSGLSVIVPSGKLKSLSSPALAARRSPEPA
jgi:hypothetical protein